MMKKTESFLGKKPPDPSKDSCFLVSKLSHEEQKRLRDLGYAHQHIAPLWIGEQERLRLKKALLNKGYDEETVGHYINYEPLEEDGVRNETIHHYTLRNHKKVAIQRKHKPSKPIKFNFSSEVSFPSLSPNSSSKCSSSSSHEGLHVAGKTCVIEGGGDGHGHGYVSGGGVGHGFGEGRGETYGFGEEREEGFGHDGEGGDDCCREGEKGRKEGEVGRKEGVFHVAVSGGVIVALGPAMREMVVMVLWKDQLAFMRIPQILVTPKILSFMPNLWGG